MNRFADNILITIKSRGFFKFVIGFFIFEASWIALTASYPQAFDENFHFGLIQLYSHHWLPFLSKQPANANAYGAVARDPSYLYHYLMSFPYRLIALFVKRQAYQIIILRFINVGLFASGLLLFKQILIRTRLSEGLANLTLLLFCLIPIVPQLAGQINYDNMLFPLVGAVCLLTFDLIDQVKKLRPSAKTLLLLVGISTLTSIVKYAFLPIYLSVVVFLAYFLLRHYRAKLGLLLKRTITDFKKQTTLLKVGLVTLVIVGAGLFAQRDVVNLIKYHAIEPDCAAVLNIKDCSSYSPWLADYTRHQSVVEHQVPSASKNIFYYVGQWVYWMWYRLFFAINGPARSFENFPPLPFPSAIAAVVAFAGLIALFIYRKAIFAANPYALFMVMASSFYLVALVIQGYVTYQFTAILENMNGRYLLPILLLVIALFGKAFSIALNKSPSAKIIVAAIVVFMFLQGGGLITFIARSDQTWDWQNNKVITVNNAARKVTNKLIIHGSKSYDTPYWFFN